jgi:hypothetical protein
VDARELRVLDASDLHLEKHVLGNTKIDDEIHTRTNNARERKSLVMLQIIHSRIVILRENVIIIFAASRCANLICLARRMERSSFQDFVMIRGISDWPVWLDPVGCWMALRRVEDLRRWTSAGYLFLEMPVRMWSHVSNFYADWPIPRNQSSSPYPHREAHNSAITLHFAPYSVAISRCAISAS